MPTLPHASPGSPNVVVIVFDDLGFGQLGCYGSAIDTPHLDALAAGGLRYNRFHVTSLCSPSRAALLTGRNHHRVGVGFLVDLPLDAPGYDARRPVDAGTLPEVLVSAGYAATAVGKWHLTPAGSRSHAGPFGSWPLGWGFERYYGFLRGDTNQWAPELVQDNHYVDPPRRFDEGYHLSEDLVDRTIRNIRDQRQATPAKPSFTYLAFGAMHAPHHVDRRWVEPYRGRFDRGWDHVRQATFDRQVAEGIVPPTARLTERPPWVAAWDDLDDDSRRLFLTMQETYAGFLSHTDAQIGRLIEFLRAEGQLDNTLVMVMSDNGASAEAGALGSVNEHRFSARLPEDVRRSLEFADDWGGPRTYSHYSWGWAWAGNTPFRLWKRYSWLGGTRSPLIAHWPARITDAGAVRSQVTHIVDVMPTVLDACGVAIPGTLGGVVQSPLDGRSMVDSFTDAAAPSPRQVQYFEMLGSRSLIMGEWKATTDHVSRGVVDEETLLEGSRQFATDRWSLFRMDDDYSEALDVAEQHPDVLAEMITRWDIEAERNQVFPLKDNLLSDDTVLLEPPYPVNRSMTYHPDASPVIDDLMPMLGFGGSVRVRLDAPDGGGQGVLCQLGDWSNGFAIVVIAGRPMVALSYAGEASRAQAADALASGEHEVGALFRPAAAGDQPQLVLEVDGVEVASAACPIGFPFHWQHGGTTFTLGRARGLPVDSAYTTPFPWTGTVHGATVTAGRSSARPLAQRIADSLRAE